MAKPKSAARISIISASADPAGREAGIAAVGSAGATPCEADEAQATLVALSPALLLERWVWDVLPGLQAAGHPLLGLEISPTSRAGSPLRFLHTVPRGGGDEALRAVIRGERPAANPDPEPAPAYPSEAAREAGEQLWALHALRDADPTRWAEPLAARQPARRRPVPGECFGDGRWRLLERQAPTVWTAWDRALAVRVAVEFGPAGLSADEALVERFLARIDRLRSAAGPGVVPILHAGVEGEQVFVVRAWRSGSLRAAALGPLEYFQAILETAHGLARCQGVGEPHGRLDASAIWLDARGEASVAGFGSLDQGLDRRRSLFDAPESLGLEWVPDARADVFSLGMVLLQLLHGAELPFWVLREPERILAGLVVPAVVRDVIRQAIDWDLDRRLATPDQFLAAFLADDALVLSLADALEGARPEAAAAHLERLAEKLGGEALHARLGRLLVRLGDRPRALAHFSEALAVAAEPDGVLAEIRGIAAETNDPSGLIAALAAEAGRRRPAQRIPLLAELAELQEQALGDRVAATATWERVLAEHHEPGVALVALDHLARLAQSARDVESFLAYARDALPYVPAAERPERHAAIGAAYLVELRDEANALLWLDRAEAAGFVSIELARHLEEIRARKGQWVAAIALMRRQASHQPTAEAGATLLRAANLARCVQLGDAATEILEEVLGRDPAHPAALRGLARHRGRLGRAGEALELLGRLVATDAADTLDHLDYARALFEAGRAEEARPWIDRVLEREPVQGVALRMRARLSLVAGDTVAAEAAWASLARSLAGGADQLEPLLGLAEIAWFRGNLAEAHAAFLRVVEVDPTSGAGWWGLAKVSMSAWGDPAVAESMPWIKALPARFTPQEALARLLMGVLEVEGLRAWMDRWPLGRAIREGGQGPVRLAAAAVDLLAGSAAVHELLRRYAVAWPDWARALEAVGALWGDSKGSTEAFPVSRCYRWSSAWLDDAPDPDALSVRSILPPPPPPTLPIPAPAGDDHLALLAGGSRPSSPDSEALAPDPPTEIYLGSVRVPTLCSGNQVVAALNRGQDALVIGSDPASDVVLPGLALRHARLLRSAGFVYLLPLDGEVTNPAACGGTRLLGGETVQLGGLALTFRWYDRDEDVQRDSRPPSPRAAPLLPSEPPPAVPPAVAAGLLSVPPRADEGAGGYDEVPVHALPRLPFDRPKWATGPVPSASEEPLFLSPTSDPLPPGLLETNPGRLTGMDVNPLRGAARASVPPVSSPPTAPRVRGAVEVMSGPERGYTRFVHGEITVGRGREAGIHIASDTQLSRVHCRVVERAGGYFLVDNDSTRGTVVNGKKITEVQLRGGEVIMAGRTVFSFQFVVDEPDRSDDATDMRDAS